MITRARRGGCDAPAIAIQKRKSVMYGDSRPPESQTVSASATIAA